MPFVKYMGREPILILSPNKEAALQNADALIICTEWSAFRAPDFEYIKAQLKHPVIFDGRNLYDPIHMREKGIVYYGIGRGESIIRDEVVEEVV